MADPRFYDNKGPFSLGEICARIGITVPPDVSPDRRISDVSSLRGAGPDQLTFVLKWSAEAEQSKAGTAFVPADLPRPESVAPSPMTLVPVAAPTAAMGAAIAQFYPDAGLVRWDQTTNVHPTAKLEAGVNLAPGAVIGPNVEIGAGTRVGANASIGRGVTIGRDCEIGASVALSHTYIGDRVVILPQAAIGQPGFGFASGPNGHTKVPQIGRVIIQDKVEIGSGSMIDRGALGDTIIGEGTKIDNLVQIGHNCRIGRHCIIVALVGMSGSCELEDFVVLGGQVGLADHVHIGQGARFAARSGAIKGMYPGGQDYGGVPARPVQQWRREVAALALLARGKKRNSHEQ